MSTMNHRAKQRPVKEWFNRHANVVVYGLLAAIVMLAFFLDHRNQQEDEKERCLAGVDTRTAQRALVEAVYNLATGAVVRDADAPPLTKRELQLYNDYIERANKFRDNQYQLIKPAALCRKYVNDDRVVPPTPPIPPLTIKGSRKNG